MASHGLDKGSIGTVGLCKGSFRFLEWSMMLVPGFQGVCTLF